MFFFKELPSPSAPKFGPWKNDLHASRKTRRASDAASKGSGADALGFDGVSKPGRMVKTRRAA